MSCWCPSSAHFEPCPLLPQDSPRESFEYWQKALQKTYKTLEVRGFAGAQGRWVGVARQLDEVAPGLPALQEYEERYKVWFDNLKYVYEYNMKHTSHWVSPSSAALAPPPP